MKCVLFGGNYILPRFTWPTSHTCIGCSLPTQVGFRSARQCAIWDIATYAEFNNIQQLSLPPPKRSCTYILIMARKESIITPGVVWELMQGYPVKEGQGGGAVGDFTLSLLLHPVA